MSAKKKILVTGATGFIGSHLVDYLAAAGHDVVATGRKAPSHDASNVRGLALDLTDRAKVDEAIGAVKPDVVYHLAAQSLPGVAWKQPQVTIEANVIGTLHLLDAVLASKTSPTIEFFGSASEYASNPETNKFIREDFPLEPSNPYALTKIAADHLCSLYQRAHGMKIVTVRPFFIIGTRKIGDVTSDFARSIVRIERGEKDRLGVGNLTAVRDFLDVRDALRAFELIANRGESGNAYNVCSGRGLRVQELLDMLVAHAKAKIDVRPSEAAMRPLDEPIRIGDPTRLIGLGWKAELPIDRALGEILDYWRTRGPD